MKELLALKKKIAKKRSYYVRSDAHKRVCIPLKWRTPRGCHNKIRLKKRGKVSHPNPGVASPRAVRGMTRHGLRPIQVETLKQLESINLKTECALINNVGIVGHSPSPAFDLFVLVSRCFPPAGGFGRVAK